MMSVCMNCGVTVMLYQLLSYDDDLYAANNLNMVVEKLPPSLCIKWKEHKRDKMLMRPNLRVVGETTRKGLTVEIQVHRNYRE